MARRLKCGSLVHAAENFLGLCEQAPHDGALVELDDVVHEALISLTRSRDAV
jgi:hypothetical protein